jgi:heme-degrading monooxygenase HmoA
MNIHYSGGMAKGRGYTIIWEFHVKPEDAARFEQAYGPAGEWAQFFRTGTGYLGTTLNRDAEQPGRYLTLDFWESAGAYQQFR